MIDANYGHLRADKMLAVMDGTTMLWWSMEIGKLLPAVEPAWPGIDTRGPLASKHDGPPVPS